jgi:hypothetical protein
MCKGTVSDEDNLGSQYCSTRARHVCPSAHLLFGALDQPSSKICRTFQDRLPLIRPVPFLEAALVEKTCCSHCQESATYFAIPPRHNKRCVDLANVKGQPPLCECLREDWLHIVCSIS